MFYYCTVQHRYVQDEKYRNASANIPRLFGSRHEDTASITKPIKIMAAKSISFTATIGNYCTTSRESIPVPVHTNYKTVPWYCNVETKGTGTVARLSFSLEED